MTELDLARSVHALCMEPSVKTEDWLKCTDALGFLSETTRDAVPVYLSARGFYVYSVFVPASKLDANYTDDLMMWNFSPSRGWSYWESGPGREPNFRIARPLEHTGSKILDAGEPVVFLREFDGYPTGSKSYCEANQRFTQLANIHWVSERGAFCRLDQNGDFVDVLSIRDEDDLLLCVGERDALDLYMLMTESALVRVFDVFRYLSVKELHEGHLTREPLNDEAAGLHAELPLNCLNDHKPVSGVLRGVQVFRCGDPHREWRRLTKRPTPQYATFVIWDWKNKLICEWPCDPAKLGNYFVPSDSPYETSPVFFRPDVLLKYKADPAKYTLDYSSISCRGAWHLQTYGLNDSGQVFTYICYLSHLPHSEQLYWKSFNEEPKAGIPERRITTDFKGEFWTGYDPLLSLKRSLETFPTATHDGEAVAIFKLPADGLAPIHYVFTESPKEWKDQILELTKIVVDGLNMAAIQKVARHLKCYDPSLGSIKLLLACLRARSVDQDVVEQIGRPLSELQGVRSTFSAHGGGPVPRKRFRDDFRRRLEETHRAMERLSGLVEKGALNVS